jgi:hypothetical protein
MEGDESVVQEDGAQGEAMYEYRVADTVLLVLPIL